MMTSFKSSNILLTGIFLSLDMSLLMGDALFSNNKSGVALFVQHRSCF